MSSAGGGTRTHTPLRITDFESVSSAIPTHRQNQMPYYTNIKGK